MSKKQSAKKKIINTKNNDDADNTVIKLALKQDDLKKLKLCKKNETKKSIKINALGTKSNDSSDDDSNTSDKKKTKKKISTKKTSKKIPTKKTSKKVIAKKNHKQDSDDSDNDSNNDSDNDSDSDDSIDTQSASDRETKKKKIKCAGCKHRDAKLKAKDTKIKEMKAIIKELSDNVKKTNDINIKKRGSVYSKINFVSIDSKGKKKWASKTDIGCHWCKHTFTDPPCSIPDKFHNGIFYVFGCYCSFNCAVAHIILLGGRNMWERYSLIHKLYRLINKTKTGVIKPADHFGVLKFFGGHKTIKEFRKDNLVFDKESKLVMPPLQSIVPIIENNYNTDAQVTGANMALAGVDKRIKLRRKKPLMKKSGLIDSMGLKIK